MAKPSIDELIAMSDEKQNKSNSKSLYKDSSGGNSILDNIKTLGGGIKDFGVDVALGSAQPALDVVQGANNILSNDILSNITGEKYKNYNYDLTKMAPDPEFASAVGVPASFALPGGSFVKGAKGINALARNAALGAGYGSTMGASRDTDYDLIGNALLGAIFPAGLMGITKGVGSIPTLINKGKESLTKSQLDKLEKASKLDHSRTITPEEAKKRLAMIGSDLPIDLGTLIGDVGIANAYRKGSNVIGSANLRRMEKAVAHTDTAANRMAEELTQGHNEATATEALINHIKSNKEFENNVKTKLYNAFEDAASQRGILTNERPNSTQLAQEIMKQHADTENVGGVSWLSGSPYLRIIEKMSKGISPMQVDKQGNILKQDADFNDLKQFRTFIDNQKRTQESSPILMRNNEAITNLSKIKQAINEDMGVAIDKEKNPDLFEMWKDANNHYRDNVVPYNKNDKLEKILKDSDSKTLFNNLNSTDKNMKKVISDMDPHYKKILLGLGFKNAITNDPALNEVYGNAAKLSGGYKKLINSPILKQVLSESDHDTFKKIQAMHDMTKDYRPILRNPETGAKNFPLMMHAAQIAPEVGALAASLMTGSPIPAIAGGIGTAAWIKSKNAISDILSNPKVLEAYANPAKRDQLIKEGLSQSKAIRKQQLGQEEEQVSNSKLKQLSKKAKGAGKKAASSISNPAMINYLLNMGNS